MNKVYCEDCKFSIMEMISDENTSPVDGGRWHQKWNCKNPSFTIKFNSVNKPYVGEVDCIKLNKCNNCKKFTSKTWWQANKINIFSIGLYIFCIGSILFSRSLYLKDKTFLPIFILMSIMSGFVIICYTIMGINDYIENKQGR